MSRATATAIRKAQQQSHLYAPVWTREHGRDRLHGDPVVYRVRRQHCPRRRPAALRRFVRRLRDGYIIGDRGGPERSSRSWSPLATSRETILLGCKRVDGRVRRWKPSRNQHFSQLTRFGAASFHLAQAPHVAPRT